MPLGADLIIVNGNIITMDPTNPTGTALAVKSYKILAVGTDEQILDLVRDAQRVIDLGGKTVIPGFVDAHTHLTSSGVRSTHVQLSTARSIEIALTRMGKAVKSKPAGEWVRGQAWDESKWPQKRYITARDLDALSTEHPIAATRIDGHLVSVNTLAFKKLNVPIQHEGVEKDKTGKPTGVLKDIDETFKKLRAGPEEVRRGVLAGNKIANELGITAAVDNVSEGYLREIRAAETSNQLTVRMIVNLPAHQMKHMIELGLTSGMGSPLVRIGGVKSFVDGSIGARTAYLNEDYSDDSGNKGLLLIDQKKLTRFVDKAVENNIQTVTHAIGDAAIEVVIAAFEDIGDKLRVRKQRHRIEHAELISENQIRRAVSLGLILSMQPNFVGQWQKKGGMYYDRLGAERVEIMHMFRLALDNGARLCFGSDGMPYGPLYGIWCAINHPSRKKGRLTLDEALRCYTMESAYSAFMENNIGSLTTGKRADFVMLSDNIMEVPAGKIRSVKVDMTAVGGIIEYSSVRA